MSVHKFMRGPFCGYDSIRDITIQHRIRMAKENPHDQMQGFDVKFYNCNKCSREFESTEEQPKSIE